MKRAVVYVTGTRADFGLLRRTLTLASRSPLLDLSLCVTGMHLAATHGHTVSEIRASGLSIAAEIPVELEPRSGAAMARAIGQQLISMTELFDRLRPDLVVVLGDRGEMLAGALAAIHLNIHLVHLHGGERSGTIDEPVRHAVSKLAHFHLVAMNSARERLIRMGEDPRRIFVTGAPGLDSIRESVTMQRAELCEAVGFDPERRIALVVYHPVLQEASWMERQTRELAAAIKAERIQALWLMPNSDAGGDRIRSALDAYRDARWIRFVTHLPRPEYVSWMAAADVMIGNSSSGIIEAASLNLPVVNVGSRQRGRERGANVVDCEPERHDVRRAIAAALALRGQSFVNPYGDGLASERIVELLETLPLDETVLQKSNAY